MRLARLFMAGCLAAALCGCATDDDAPKVVAAAPPPQAALSPDIQKILAAGGIDATQPGAPKGVRLATTAIAPPGASPAQASASGITEVAVADVPKSRKRRRGDRKDPTRDVAAGPLPELTAYAPPPNPVQASAQGATPSVEQVAAIQSAPTGQRDVATLPSGPLPDVSPNSPPIRTFRLPTVASSPEMIPADAPRQAVVTSTPVPVNYNFLSGVGAGAQQQVAPPLQQMAPQPMPTQQPMLASFPGAVAGPTPQQVLQPILDPNTLMATPRATRGGYGRRERPNRRTARETPLPRSRPVAVAAPPSPVSRAPVADSESPAIRRF